MRGGPLAVLMLAGCAHTASAPPLTGWRELQSTHIRLRTDLPEGSARSTLTRLEDLRRWLQTAWSTGGDSPGATDAIVLDSPSELRTFTELRGLATTTRRGAMVVASGVVATFGDRSPDQRLLAHEMAHDLIRRRMPAAPRWFQEGLASYLESVGQPDAGHVRFGFLSASRPGAGGDQPAAAAASRSMLPLDIVSASQWEASSSEELFELQRSARGWIHLLRAEEPGRWRALEVAAASGVPWETAWATFRRGLDVNRYQEKLWRLQRSGGWPLERRVLPPAPAPEVRASRPLASWETHLILAELWDVRTGADRKSTAPDVRRELEAAVAEAPDQPAPQVRLAELETDPRLRRERAEALVRRFPDAAESRVFLARALYEDGGPVEGRREAAQAAVRLAPDDVAALIALAVEDARAGEVEAGLAGVSRAAELEPWNPNVFLARGTILVVAGRCPDAVDAVQRALDILPDNPPAGEVRALLTERERVRNACWARPGG